MSGVHGPQTGLAQFALDRARQAAEAGEFDEALEWLAQAPKDNPSARALEAEVRYRRAAILIAKGEYTDAEGHLRKVTRLGTIPQFLIDERLRLLRLHESVTRDLEQLLERFGSECEDCDGADYFTIATCRHQEHPIPLARKLPVRVFAPVITGVYAASCYRSGWDRDRNHPLNQLVRWQKQQMNRDVMRLLGVVLADYLAFHTPLPPVVDLVVPVPTSRDREEVRGGSLPFVFASTIRDLLALPLQEAIVQVAQHLDHTQAHGDERRRGLRAAWEVKVDRRLAGRSVLLVDDIVTTGTTLKTAAELLREGGVGDVYALALLHTEGSSSRE